MSYRGYSSDDEETSDRYPTATRSSKRGDYGADLHEKRWKFCEKRNGASGRSRGGYSSDGEERCGRRQRDRSHRRWEEEEQATDDGDEDYGEDEESGQQGAALNADPARALHDVFTTETVGNVEIAKLEAERERLEEEGKMKKWKLQAHTSRAGRSTEGTYVWVLIEHDNYGCERYLNTVSAIPEGWRVIFHRNARATGCVVEVRGTSVIRSACMGSNSKKDDKSALTYPVADLCFTVGDIAASARMQGTAASTTVYFVCTPLAEPPRYYEVMLMLKRFGIRSYCKNGSGCFEDILRDEGIDPTRFKSGQEHRPPARSASRGPKPRGEPKTRGL